MTRKEARYIVGNQSTRMLSGMAKALQMQTWRNTESEWYRLAALKTLGFKVTVIIPTK